MPDVQSWRCGRYAERGATSGIIMQPLLLIQTGEAPDPIRTQFGGFADWFREAMRLSPAQMRVVRPDAGEALPEPDAIPGAIISGSAAMVTERAHGRLDPRRDGCADAFVRGVLWAPVDGVRARRHGWLVAGGSRNRHASHHAQ